MFFVKIRQVEKFFARIPLVVRVMFVTDGSGCLGKPAHWDRPGKGAEVAETLGFYGF
jgi:hypothetical protein